MAAPILTLRGDPRESPEGWRFGPLLLRRRIACVVCVSAVCGLGEGELDGDGCDDALGVCK